MTQNKNPTTRRVTYPVAVGEDCHYAVISLVRLTKVLAIPLSIWKMLIVTQIKTILFLETVHYIKAEGMFIDLRTLTGDNEVLSDVIVLLLTLRA